MRFSGDFTGLTKINDYTYEMKMENLTYEETPGKEEIADGVKYIYTDVYVWKERIRLKCTFRVHR